MEEPRKLVIKKSKEDVVWLQRKYRKHYQAYLRWILSFPLFSMFKKRQGAQEKKRNRTYPYDSWASTRTSHCPLQRFSPTARLNSSFPEAQGCVYQLHWPHPLIRSANLSSADCRWEVSRGQPISKLPHHPHPLKNGRKPPHQSSSIWKNCSSWNYHWLYDHWLYKFQLFPLQHETRNPPAKLTRTHQNPEIFPKNQEKPKFWSLELKKPQSEMGVLPSFLYALCSAKTLFYVRKPWGMEGLYTDSKDRIRGGLNVSNSYFNIFTILRYLVCQVNGKVNY